MSINVELSNEENLVLLLSRITFLEKDERELSELLKEKMDWYKILNIAIKNKVATLIWHNIRIKGLIEKIPANIERILNFYYVGTKNRNEIFLDNLNIITNAFNNNEIFYSLLKGAYLIPNIYIDYGIRTINDVDCMIKYSQIKKVKEIMESLGYIQGDIIRETNEIKPISREKELLWKTKMTNMYPFKKLISSVFCNKVEVDFSFSLNYELNTSVVEEMLDRANSDNFAKYKILNPEDFFTHLCCHLYKEASNATWVVYNSDLNLIKFCDVREFVLQKMNKEQLIEAVDNSKKNGIQDAIYFTLFYLKKIYNDGYESELIDLLEINDMSFLNEYGERDYGKKTSWKKTFWQRLFSLSNMDELDSIPKYFDIK